MLLNGQDDGVDHVNDSVGCADVSLHYAGGVADCSDHTV